MKTSKLISLLLSGAMLAGLAACGDSPANTPNTPSATPNATSTQEASPYPEYLNLDGYRPIVKEGTDVTLSLMVRRDANASSNINDNYFVKFIEEVLNVNLEIEEVFGDTAERRNLMFASNDLKDIIINVGLSANNIVTYGQEEGQLLAMSDYINETLTPAIKASLEGEDMAVASNTTPDGKMYTIPNFNEVYEGFGDTIGMQRVFINQKWLDGVGLSVPKTLDEFVAMLRAFKEQDPMGVGKENAVPMLSSWGQDRIFLLNAFGWLGGSILGTDPALDVDEKRVTIPCGEPEFAEYIKLINTLYTEGLIDEDFFTIDRTAARALFVEGVVGVVCDSAPYVSMPETFSDYVAAAPVTSQWTQKAFTEKSKVYTLGYTFVSSKTKYPEVCMRLIDYMFTKEGSLYSYYGPAAGSEDTLGLVGGFTLDSDGSTIVFPDVVSKKRESEYDYRVNSIILSQAQPTDPRGRELYRQELLGIANPQYKALDLTNGDDHYRYLCFSAHQGFLVDGLPTAFLGSDLIDKTTDLYTVINSYVQSETARFIVGQRPLSELDSYFQELKNLGYDEYRQIYVDLYSDYTSGL